MNHVMSDMSRSGDLIARLWRHCRDTARVWIPLGKDEPAEKPEKTKQTPDASRSLAGRWPDAADLLAHRMKALDPDATADDAGERDKPA